MEYITMQEVWDQIEAIPGYARKKSSLLKVREFLGLLGEPDREFQVIHVAGTNGKGSVCAFLTSMIREAKIPCGTFVSPHLVDIRERFLINGEIVPEPDFIRAFLEVQHACRIWEKRGEPHPTYFEFLFYMGLCIFRNAGVRVLVLETGMGGTYDVTNVVENPLVSVITSISIDHTAFLGSTIPEIAAHKAGIIKSRRPVVYDDSSSEAAAVIFAKAKEMKSEGFPVTPDEVCRGIRPCLVKSPDPGVAGHQEMSFSYRGEEILFEIPFAAPYQLMNAALAIRALEVSGLPVAPEQAAEGVKKAKWPARMEEISTGVYLDGAHNADGIRAFLDAACRLKELRKPDHVRILFAVSADKDHQRMLREIAERLKPDLWILSKMESHRTLSVEDLEVAAEKLRAECGEETEYRVSRDVKHAVKELLDLHGERDLSFIAGSLYLAGEVKEQISKSTS